MKRPDTILGLGLLFLLLVSTLGTADENIGGANETNDILQDSGVIFTEASVDVTPSGDIVTSTSASSHIEYVNSSSVSTTPTPTSRSKVPPSFQKYIDELRRSASVPHQHQQVDPIVENEVLPAAVGVKSEPVVGIPPSIVPPATVGTKVVPHLPSPPLKAISAIIRDLEKQKRDYDSIKNAHPKIHLIPQRFASNPSSPIQPVQLRGENNISLNNKTALQNIGGGQAKIPTPNMEGSKPVMPSSGRGQIRMPTQILEAPMHSSGGGQAKVPTPSLSAGKPPMPSSVGGVAEKAPSAEGQFSGRWLWNWFGLGGEGVKGVDNPIPIPPTIKPTDVVDEFGMRIILKPAEHPEPGQGYYECPFLDGRKSE